MRLVTGQTVHWSHHLSRNRGVHQIRNRVTIHRMPHTKFQGQRYNLVLDEVVFGQLYASIEDGDHVLGFHFPRIAIGSVALQA